MFVKLVATGTLTVILYSAFFASIDSLSDLFTSGTVYGAVAVIVTASVFSVVHGAFARYLLEAVGFRAMKSE